MVDAGTYRVIIGASLRHDYATLISTAAPAHHYTVVSDSTVAPLYAHDLLSALAPHGRATLHVVPAGEASKSRESWISLTDAMLAAGCGRDTTVVALGGGMIGDLAGFVAATYMRGVPVVQCPTSLLAMIDASVGGKTGVDTPAGKNLVGAFHTPAAVLADVELLRTLPTAHRRAGLAEAIKHGVVADADYFRTLGSAIPLMLADGAGGAAGAAMALKVVERSVSIKAAVVAADAREHGVRKTLNFGHTLGHAVEHASGFALLHGECVAIGMMLEARIAELLGVASPGLADEIAALLELAGLPVTRPAEFGADVLLHATRLDKKARAGTVEYALPAAVGIMAGAESDWGIAVPDAVVREVLA